MNGSGFSTKKVFSRLKKKLPSVEGDCKKISYYDIGEIITAIWLFCMMAIPYINAYLKIILMLGVAMISIIQRRNSIKWKSKWLVALVIWILFYLFSMCLGIMNGFSFDFELFEIYIIRPVLFFLMSSSFCSEKGFIRLAKILLYMTLLICVYDIIYMMGIWGIIPQIIVEPTNNVTIITDSFLTIRISNLTAMMYLVPFIFPLFFNCDILKKQRKVIVITTILAVIITVFSGRRAMQLEVLCMLILNIIAYLRKGGKSFFSNRLLKIFSGFIVLLLFEQILENLLDYKLISVVIQTVWDALNTATGGETIRGRQMIDLIKGWLDSPVLGHGLQSYSQEYNSWRASVTGKGTVSATPWSYEFFYLALLFQTGLVGILLVMIYIWNIFKSIYTVYKEKSDNIVGVCALAYMSGGMGFIIAGGTNPMITSPWMWFITLAAYFYSDRIIHTKRKTTK